MKLPQNSSIRQRLISIILTVSFVSVVITTLAISIIGVVSLRQTIIADLDVSATIVGDRNRAAILFGKTEQAESNLAILGVKPPITQACLYDPLGTIFVKYVNTKYKDMVTCPAEIGQYAKIVDSRIHLMRSIEGMAGGVDGYIYLESTLEQVDSYIEKQTTIALTVVLAALIISYLLAVNLQRSITRPILSLADVARQISVFKDYSIRAPLMGNLEKDHNNELVILTHSFNTMLTEINERDVQLKTQNTELEKARDAAEASNRAKSQFLANISHELRTPLNAIIGFSSILMNQLFGALGDNKYLEYSKDINESGIHLLDIINDILDLSKAEAGKLDLAYEEVHILKAVQKCVTILAERAQKGKVTVTTDIPKMLPPLVVDRLRFIQIILNIMSNAIKFTGEGGRVDLTVQINETKQDSTYFEIIVKDTGIGMTAQDVEKAVKSFGQVDSGLNRKYEGTGLGLPLTKKLVELHHGYLKINSEPGKGTEVTLGFPSVPPAGVTFME